MDRSLYVATVDLDYSAFAILAKANPGRAYFELLAKLLIDADRAWAKRILMFGGFRNADASDEEMEPLFGWMETRAFSGTEHAFANRELIEQSAWAIRTLLTTDTKPNHDKKTIERRFLPLLEKSPHVSDAFWLAATVQPSWSIGFRHAVMQRALRALKDPAASPKMVAQAAMILRESLSNPAMKEELKASEVATAVRFRLSAIAADPPRIWQLVEVETTFRDFAIPRLPSSIQVTIGDYKASEIMKLLDLVAALKSQGEAEFELGFIVKATNEAYRKVAPLTLPQLSPRGSALQPKVQIYWSTLDSYTVSGGGAGPVQLPLAPTDWLGFLICSQAAEVAKIPLPTLHGASDPIGNPATSAVPNK